VFRLRLLLFITFSHLLSILALQADMSSELYSLLLLALFFIVLGFFSSSISSSSSRSI